jgi:hypothetical protein
MAGRRGLGALAFQFLSADAAHAWVHAYYNSFTKRLDKRIRVCAPRTGAQGRLNERG